MYRFEARIVGRSQGKSATKSAAHNTGKRNSAVKAAAYLSRSEMTDATGQGWDYSSHFGGAGAMLLLPKGAPAEFSDREFLWRSVEKIENRKDSMLARDPIITMPWQLTQKEMWAATTKFARQEFVSQGKPVDLGLHIYGEPWKAERKATKEKLEVWKDRGYPFYEQGQVPDDCTGPHVLIVRGKQEQIKAYHLYQPHMHLMTTFRSLDPDSPTGWAKHKDTVTNGHWAPHDKAYVLHLKKAWAEIGADALLAKGLTVDAERFRVGYLTIPEQRKAAIERGDTEWADQLNRQAEPKKGPIAAKMEREDRGDESKAFLQWLQVRTGNEIIVIDRQIEVLETQQKRTKAVSDTTIASPEDIGTKQRREREENLRDRESILIDGKWRTDEAERLTRQVEHDRSHAEEEKRKEAERRSATDDFKSPRERYLDSLGQHRGSHNTFDLLLSAARIEASDIQREHNSIERQARDATDPDKKRDLLLVRDIQHAEYMADVSGRLSEYSRYAAGPNPRRELDEDGKPLPTQAERHAEQQKHWDDETTRLRAERGNLQELMLKKSMDQAVNLKDTQDLQRTAGFDPNHMEPGIYRPLDHHLERTNGIVGAGGDPEEMWRRVWEDSAGSPVRANIDKGSSEVRETVDDRRAMQQAMQAERQLNDPHHEVTGRISDALKAVRAAEENLAPEKHKAEEGRTEKWEKVVADRETAKTGLEEGVAHDKANARGGFSL